jgi:HD-GYP domain-containing protein (c-di-GMP phosphodiesterase class II)
VEAGVLQRVVALACRLAAVDEAVVLLRGRGRSSSLVAVAWHGRHGGPLPSWREGQAAVRRALATGLPAAESGRGRRLSAAAPLMVDGEARGVLALTSLARSTIAPARPFRADQLELLAELADLAASALIERDLRARAETVLDAGVAMLTRAVDIRDDYTGRHSAQVGDLARRVGGRIGMEEQQLDLLQYAARLHDVGKLSVPDAILQKPGPLDADEWAVMRRHPEWGAEMVAQVPGLEELATLVVAHHERWDGHGYPNGLAGERIPLASRVISACDAFEAMVSRRPYRAPLSVEEALAELVAASGTQFDPQVVEAVKVEAAT